MSTESIEIDNIEIPIVDAPATNMREVCMKIKERKKNLEDLKVKVRAREAAHKECREFKLFIR